jgi:hypothetical protein
MQVLTCMVRRRISECGFGLRGQYHYGICRFLNNLYKSDEMRNYYGWKGGTYVHANGLAFQIPMEGMGRDGRNDWK